MAHRGHLDGLSTQAPGLMRHGSFAAASLSRLSSLDSSATLEMLENKLSMQTAEVENLIRENQRLAKSHEVLRQDIVDTEKEMQMIRAHLGEIQEETDLQIRDLLERIRLMEADIHSGDAVKKELHQVHMEAKRLTAERQMLTLEIGNVTKEQHKFSASVDNKNLPELFAELDGLRKEHHSLRSQFEYEKNTNIKQVEQMRTMEMNLITMTKEAEKLRADVANAERRAQAQAAAAAQAAGAQVTASQPGTAQATAVSAAANPYASAYANYPSAYQHGTQPGAYQQGTQPGAYQQGTQPGAYTYTTAYDAATAYQMHAAQGNAYAGYSGYPVAAYAQSALHSYPAAYAVPPHPVSSSAATDVASLYGTVGSAGYPAGQVQPSSGTANAGQEPPPTAPYPGTYDPTRAQR
ncbi:protein FLX-like 4 isoform X2 [Phragmites australis]|uniref:protein FLX-like 4 isoform X2 n=1 Tax=Phragmites australis TaxID=29695 RepID=UPI002D795AA3|nr:protein FLX-like 4 isoform X2 [Phragmites australis]